MFNKSYILRMLDLLGKEGYSDILSIEGIFSGVKELYEDKEVCGKLMEALKKLVEIDNLTASQAEGLIRKHFPKLIGKPDKPLVTFVGPFKSTPGNAPVMIDFSKMGKDWIRKYSYASLEERKDMMRPHLDE